MTITMYCEGESDKPILNHILNSLPIAPRLVPTGGKRGAGEFIKVHHNLVAKTDFYLFLEIGILMFLLCQIRFCIRKTKRIIHKKY